MSMCAKYFMTLFYYVTIKIIRYHIFTWVVMTKESTNLFINW